MEVSSEFTVCSVGGGGGASVCISVHQGRKAGELVLSFQSGAIQVYNVIYQDLRALAVHDLRILHSWQLSTSERFVCGALAHPNSDVYWALSSKQGLVQWNEGDTVVNSSPISISTNPIKLMVSHGNPLPLIAYANGRVGYVGGAPVALVTGDDWEVVMVDVSCDGVVCVVGREHEDISVGIAESADGRLAHPFISSLPGRGPLASCCVCGNTLLLLYHHGDLLVLTLEAPLHPDLYHHTLPPPPPVTCILPLSCDYFALATSHSLQLWDKHYGTCQHTIDTQIPQSSKLWCVGGVVYMWCSDKGLMGWRVKGGVSKLSAALGKLPLREVMSSVLPSWPVNQEGMVAWEEKCAESSSIDQYLSSLVDPSATPNLKVFSKVFASRPISANFNYHDVIERLLSEKGFWGCGPLSRLLKEGVVPSSINILGRVVARGDWELAMTCLTHGPHPSEKCIISTLQNIFSLSSDLEHIGSGKVARKELVFNLLCQPFNDVDMEPLLAATSFTTIKGILSFLSDYVTMEYLLSEHSFSYDVILEWVGLVLDVHFTHLILDRQCRQMLISLQSRILAQVMCLTRLSGLNSIVPVQENNKKNCNYGNQWLYKVDKIDLQSL